MNAITFLLESPIARGSFEPVSGTWTASPQWEDRDYFAVRDEIAARIEAESGVRVDVTLYHQNGNEITSDLPVNGTMLVREK